MTLFVLVDVLLALIASTSLAGAYLVWPRRMTAEEWVLHRRRAALGPTVTATAPSWLSRLGSAVPKGVIQVDLNLLVLLRLRPEMTDEEFALRLARRAAIGFGVGLAVGLGLWGLSGRPEGWIALVMLVPAACILAPTLHWLGIRRQATTSRAAIRRQVPRLLTAARVLLQSGAVTPQRALQTAAAVYSDPAAHILREALRDERVRRVPLQDSLDLVGRRSGVEPLCRLADAFRMSNRQGTQMADLLSSFAGDLRQGWHTEYRERIIRAPVLMTLPALLFFVLPLLLLTMILVFVPLFTSLSQL